VALAAGGDRLANVAGALAGIDYQVDWGSYRRIIVKPNFTSVSNQVAATHVDAVRALLGHVRQRFDGEIWLIEGGGGAVPLVGFRAFGYTDLVREFGVELHEIGEAESVAVEVRDHALRPLQVRADRRMAESEFTISICPPKVHNAVIFTGALKNVLMGSLIVDRGKAGWLVARAYRRANRHLRRLSPSWWPDHVLLVPVFARRSRLLSDAGLRLLLSLNPGDSRMLMHQSIPVLNLNLYLLARRLRPHLSVVDGYEGMEGDGPLHGTPVRLGFALARRTPWPPTPRQRGSWGLTRRTWATCGTAPRPAWDAWRARRSRLRGTGTWRGW
jgi:uncharacterized protein (DUF362 family)